MSGSIMPVADAPLWLVDLNSVLLYGRFANASSHWAQGGQVIAVHSGIKGRRHQKMAKFLTAKKYVHKTCILKLLKLYSLWKKKLLVSLSTFN